MLFGVRGAGNARRAGWLALLLLLAGCASNLQVVRGPKSEAPRPDYREAQFMPPENDPRGVVPKVVAQLEGAGLKVSLLDPKKPVPGAQGTAFLVTAAGHLLSCAHVVGEDPAATVWIDGARYDADVVARDTRRDLALLKLRGTPPAVAPVSLRDPARFVLGADVFTIGYPLSSLLGSGARLTRGSISATTGAEDNPAQIQVSAQVQPGNSGGPLFDQEGVAVGVVAETLNAVAVAAQTGAVPQNVNFAVKGSEVLAFLRAAAPEVAAQLVLNRPASTESLPHAVVKVRAGNLPEGSGAGRLLVRLDYASYWDVWFHFRLFVLRFWDLDSQRPLFMVHQARLNPGSSEDSVIRDAFERVRQELGKPPLPKAP